MDRTKLIRNAGGHNEYTVDLRTLRVPDLWPVIEALQAHLDEGKPIDVGPMEVSAVHDAWGLCRDLIEHARRLMDE